MLIPELTPTERIYHVLVATEKKYYVARCGKQIPRGKNPPALKTLGGYSRCPDCKALMFPCRAQARENGADHGRNSPGHST
jgi:hypothetical protein